MKGFLHWDICTLPFQNRAATCKSPWRKPAPTTGLHWDKQQQRCVPQDSGLLLSFLHWAQELSESGGGHPGLPALSTYVSLMVSVDAEQRPLNFPHALPMAVPQPSNIRRHGFDLTHTTVTQLNLWQRIGFDLTHTQPLHEDPDALLLRGLRAVARRFCLQQHQAVAQTGSN